MAYLINNALRQSRRLGVRRYNGAALVFSEEVRLAQAEGRPVVALESTIISHGMPYPKNLETAIQVENIIRERGAVPATVAILKGQLTIGLSENQLQYLAQAKGVVKASRRDMAPVIAAKLDGATTVAGTIIAAEIANIPIFVTGGIGGVHREGETTLDVSADLNELGRSKTLVVCSGVKSILDIGRTLEYLETQGVCVCAFGETNDFPAFYTRQSGQRAPHRLADAKRAADVLHASCGLGLSSGIVVAVPVPEENAMNEMVIEKAIDTALSEAKENGVHGKEVTPFILAAVAKATSGASLSTNIALIKNNAKVGAEIAVEYQKLKNVAKMGAANTGTNINIVTTRHLHTSSLKRDWEKYESDTVDGPLLPAGTHLEGDVLVIGGANVDRTFRVQEDRVQFDGSTHPCEMEQCGGGVGRNMAEALWRLRGGRARLLTALGDDADGRYIADIAPGLILDGCVVKNARTPTYAAVLDKSGECLLGLGDMALHNSITPDLVDRHTDSLRAAPLVVLDGNAPQPTIDHVLRLCSDLQKPVFFEPTDRRKAIKSLLHRGCIHFSSPNVAELRAMANFIRPDLKIESSNEILEIIELSKIVLQIVQHLVITAGARGVLTISRINKESDNVKLRYYPTNRIDQIENVSGAGDCFASGFIHGILSGLNESQCVSLGFTAAKAALVTKKTVPSNLNCIAKTLSENNN